MPGHPVPKGQEGKVKEDVERLEKLFEEHDAVFLLMDSRESRWLPTVLGAAKGKVRFSLCLVFPFQFEISLEEGGLLPMCVPGHPLTRARWDWKLEVPPLLLSASIPCCTAPAGMVSGTCALYLSSVSLELESTIRPLPIVLGQISCQVQVKDSGSRFPVCRFAPFRHCFTPSLFCTIRITLTSYTACSFNVGVLTLGLSASRSSSTQLSASTPSSSCATVCVQRTSRREVRDWVATTATISLRRVTYVSR